MERVVITGLGVVSPIGSTVDEFAESLLAGRHGIRPIEHFDTSGMTVRCHAPVRGLDLEARIPRHELRRLDRSQAYGILAAREAVERSGIVGEVDPYRLGVLMASAVGGIETLLAEHETLAERGPRRVSPMLIPKWIPNLLAGLIAIEHGARGGAMSHSAACSSSSISIGEGVRAIRHGYADAVLVGGAEFTSNRLVMSGFQSLRALSPAADPDRASIPFDREREGFVYGDGAGALVLERADHAEARGAEVLAEVTGYGSTTDACHITAPADDGLPLARAIADALAEADAVREVDDDARFVHAHGTGTRMSDAAEARVIARELGEGTTVTSTKSMTGHMVGASGAIAAIAAVLALRAGLVPATVGTRELDDDMAIDVVRGAAREAAVERVLAQTIGFGGHNTCLVLDRVAPKEGGSP